MVFKTKQKTSYSEIAEVLISPLQGTIVTVVITNFRMFEVHIQTLNLNPLQTSNSVVRILHPHPTPTRLFDFALTGQGSSMYLEKWFL